MTTLIWTCVWPSRNINNLKGGASCHWKMMLRDGWHAVSGSSRYSNTSRQLITLVIWTIGTSSNTGSLLPWGKDGAQCKWRCSQAAPATACGQCSSVAGSQPAPSGCSHLQPRGPPCACAPGPGGKRPCGGGRDEDARPQWLRDRPALLVRPLARRMELAIDPFVTPSIGLGSAALRRRPPSSGPTERPDLLPGACRDEGGAPSAAMFLYGGDAKHAGSDWFDFWRREGREFSSLWCVSEKRGGKETEDPVTDRTVTRVEGCRPLRKPCCGARAGQQGYLGPSYRLPAQLHRRACGNLRRWSGRMTASPKEVF